MKKMTASVVAAIAMLTMSAFAADVTITGDAKCAKCALHETDKCQNVIEADKDGKTVKYYVVDNAVAKKFHKTVCQDTKKVTATGSVEEKDGKMMLTATKIEEAK